MEERTVSFFAGAAPSSVALIHEPAEGIAMARAPPRVPEACKRTPSSGACIRKQAMTTPLPTGQKKRRGRNWALGRALAGGALLLVGALRGPYFAPAPPPPPPRPFPAARAPSPSSPHQLARGGQLTVWW